MKFYLGTHIAHWLSQTDVPLFVSRRRLVNRKTLPVAEGSWALDSGGFSELSMYGEWRTTEDAYVAAVIRFHKEMGGLEWAAPMDWMCEPKVLAKTGLSVREHQRRTTDNYLRLAWRLSGVFIPVLQGWAVDDYLRHRESYEAVGIALEDAPLVGVGSVCRRQNTTEAARIFRSLTGLRLHGFGVKIDGLQAYADCLSSADSMAWSYRARRDYPLRGCSHKSCSNCLRYALRWRTRIVLQLGQQRLEVEAA